MNVHYYHATVSTLRVLFYCANFYMACVYEGHNSVESRGCNALAIVYNAAAFASAYRLECRFLQCLMR